MGHSCFDGVLFGNILSPVSIAIRTKSEWPKKLFLLGAIKNRSSYIKSDVKPEWKRAELRVLNLFST